MATLREAIDWAKQNPKTDQAAKLYEFITNGAADERAREENIDLSWAGRPSMPPALDESFAKMPDEEPDTFMERIKARLAERREIIGGKLQKDIETEQLTGTRKALRIAGGVAGGVSDIIFETIKPIAGPAIKPFVQIFSEAAKGAEQVIKGTEDLLRIPEGQRLHDQLSATKELAQKKMKDDPALAAKVRDLGDLGNIGMFVLDALGIEGSVLGAKGAIKTGTEIAKETGKIAIQTGKAGIEATRIGLRNMRTKFIELRYGKEAEKAISALENAYSKNVILPKNLMRAEAEEGKNFARFMAEKPYLKISVKNSKFDTFDTAQTLRQEAQTEAKALQTLLEEQKATFVALDDIENATKKIISENTIGQEREMAFKYIENELDTIRRQFKVIQDAEGKSIINVADANRIKQKLWDRSPFNPTASRQDRLASNIDYKMGQSFKRSIENSLDEIDIKTLNAELGDYYHTIEVLERIHGGAAPRGRIGLEFARMGGAIVGSQGGIVGGIAGYMTADKIAQFMVDQSISQSFKRHAVQELMQQRPKIAKQVAEILRKQGEEQTARLMLPEPSFIPAGEFKGGAGGIPSEAEREAFATERRTIQAEQEKEKFVFEQAKEAEASIELRDAIIKAKTRGELEKLPMRFKSKETWLKFAESNLLLKKKIEGVGLTLEKLWEVTH